MSLNSELDLVNDNDFESIGSGGAKLKAGGYHLYCEDVQPDQSGSIKFQFTALASTVPGEAGKKVWEFLQLTEKARWRAKVFAKAFGLITPAHLGQRVNIDWTDAIGRHVCAEVEPHDYEKEGKKIETTQIAGKIWSLNDPKAKHIPKDPNTVPEDGGAANGHANGASNGNSGAAGQPGAPAAAVPAGAFADL